MVCIYMALSLFSFFLKKQLLSFVFTFIRLLNCEDGYSTTIIFCNKTCNICSFKCVLTCIRNSNTKNPKTNNNKTQQITPKHAQIAFLIILYLFINSYSYFSFHFVRVVSHYLFSVRSYLKIIVDCQDFITAGRKIKFNNGELRNPGHTICFTVNEL